MAGARLRKTFHYPDDEGDDDDTHRGFDEQEQDKLIEDLKKEDQDRDDLYKRIFVVVPVIAAMAFAFTLTISGLFQVKLASLLCILNLSGTAYTLMYIPNTKDEASSKLKLRRAVEGANLSPLEAHLEKLNGALSMVLTLNCALFKGRRGAPDHFWLLCLLPAICSALIALVRRLMLSVDIGELEKLKYPYKGA